MSVPLDPSIAIALLSEAETRMAQALDNFFQRNRERIQDTLLRAIATQTTPSMLESRQTCLDWLQASPDRLSSAFAEQFRQHLAHPETFEHQARGRSGQLQLVDDDVLGRQLASDKIAAHLTDDLRPELLLVFGRLQSLIQASLGAPGEIQAFGPLPVIHALSRALDSLGLDSQNGTLLIQNSAAPLFDTLKHTYSALNQFLLEQGIEQHTSIRAQPAPTRRLNEPAASHGILSRIKSAAARKPAPSLTDSSAPANETASWGENGFPAALPRFLDTLAGWEAQTGTIPSAPKSSALLLRQLQQGAGQSNAGSFDLAVLDALAGVFEFILSEPDVSTHYKSAIARLQMPTLRVALESPEFFDDEQNPARQLIDLLGQFSRRFPEGHPAHASALQQIEASCALTASDPLHPSEGIAQALDALNTWLVDENTRAETQLSSEVEKLQQIESQELGTLLALQNLHDLTTRLPAPEAVLRRLESAWIPYMATLYVAESGEGAQWREACATLLQLFQSLQAPAADEREARLQSIPAINTSLRRGLLAQGADSGQLKDFFSAITRTQECWIRPDVSQPVSVVSTFVPQSISPNQVELLARQLPPVPNDSTLQQAGQLLEGDWVDFDPPFEGLTTARVAWVGVHGYLLFCDETEAQRFSLDCTQLATEIRAGRARIPEQSLTRKAMLRLKNKLLEDPA
ncbi:MAG TPA: DUF1631 family protein [Thiobacillus sp.]|nr:MAG: hypothetical protein B7Y50_02350 [Hydrogenophilales bacterium 28-61-11]OYZ58623.1 MAG: hypothetical protein B7Y21_02545 [Hydrogenophilales bacterium 16-61-112]HQT30089.1 DUF1631 family protein [Thiobacillus sp.]HQT70671.1 DUF1631 family protein [Thiobacillus sp.]